MGLLKPIKKAASVTLAAGVMLCLVQGSALAATITFDELGNGTFTNTNGISVLKSSQLNDPGPGGLSNVLLYVLGPGLVAGDLVIRDSVNLISDVLRFDSQVFGGVVFVYSDLFDGVDAPLADIGFPAANNTNLLQVTETGAEDVNGFTYTPTAGQPGFVAGSAVPVTYVFISDAPEPCSLGSSVAGLAALCYLRLRAGRRPVTADGTSSRARRSVYRRGTPTRPASEER